jgi:phage regulator Rha-like protein
MRLSFCTVMIVQNAQRGRAMADKKLIASVEQIESRIFVIRGQKVMLDTDLAELYGEEIRRLNEQVRRNIERFPEDFMFQLTDEEFTALRSQFATLKSGRGQHRKYMPYAFTEHGALMLDNVLKSVRAVEVSLMVVRAFVHLRELVSTHKELSQKLNQLERKVGAHDRAIAELISAIRQLMTPLDPKRLPLSASNRRGCKGLKPRQHTQDAPCSAAFSRQTRLFISWDRT